MLFFDWWIDSSSAGLTDPLHGVLLQLFAQEWRAGGRITYKDYAMHEDSAVPTSSASTCRYSPAILADRHFGSNKSWGYIEHDTFKSPRFIVHQLIDAVSKNATSAEYWSPCRRTIPDEVQQVLRDVGSWLKVNGDAFTAPARGKFTAKDRPGGGRLLPRYRHAAPYARRFPVYQQRDVLMPSNWAGPRSRGPHSHNQDYCGGRAAG